MPTIICKPTLFQQPLTEFTPTHTLQIQFPNSLQNPSTSTMDSRDSSPRSRDPDADNNNHHHHRLQLSSDDAPPKVKLMCSFGGSIQPRPQDNHLTYVAGDTKILAVDRHVKFPSLIAKLSSFANNTPSNLSCFKYQLPGEDLDALISVTNDDDLHQMMVEYDRLSRASPRPARLRLFLFPLHNNCNFAPTESKSERQWFVDALNSVHVPEDSRPPPPPATANPDFLFGLDKPPAEDALAKDSEGFPEDRKAEPQIENENNSKQLLQRKMKIEEDDNNNNGRVYGVNSGGVCYALKNAEKMTPLVAHAHAHAHFVHPGSVTGTVSFMQERNNNNAGYSLAVPTTGNEIYLMQTPSGMFQAVRPVTGPVGQPVYLVHAPCPVPHSEIGASAGRGGARW